MNTECVEGIVVAELRLHNRDHEIAKDAGDESNKESGHRLYETSGRSDGDKPGNRAGDSPEHACLAIAEPLGGGPSNCCGGSAKMCCHESTGCQAAGCQSATSVEAEPTDPEQTCTDKAQDHAVRWHRLLGISKALAKIQGAN